MQAENRWVSWGVFQASQRISESGGHIGCGGVREEWHPEGVLGRGSLGDVCFYFDSFPMKPLTSGYFEKLNADEFQCTKGVDRRRQWHPL